MTLTPADNVWNRAALAAGGPTPRQGDRALANLLFVHGLVMNGGVDHLVEGTSEEQMAAGIQGFRFFRLDTVAELLEDVTNGKCNPDEATERYGDLRIRSVEPVLEGSVC
jgi:hypothetical protein